MVDQRNPDNISYECQMEKTLQKLHDVVQLRQKLLLERATLKSQLDKLLQRSVNDVDLIVGDDDDYDDVDVDGGGSSTGGGGGGVGQTQSSNCQLHETEDSKSKETVKQIRSKIKELEKRCALQLLRHEEILLEIEDVRKRSCIQSNNSSMMMATTTTTTTTLNSIKNQLHNDIDSINQSTSSISSSLINNNNNKVYGRLLQLGQQNKLKQDYIQSYEMDSSLLLDPSSSTLDIIGFNKQMTNNKQVKGRLFRSNTDLQIPEGDDPNLVELFQVIEESNKSTDVPAPRMITLERQLFQSVLISWKSPELNSMNENKIVSAYHIYVDGQFRLAPHRISIRSISSHGQSKDAQCTLVVGRGMTATPARLKATQIGTKSAKLSWIPGNSNYYHRVYLNETSLHVCKPGVYKLHLTDLPPDTLHQVCVQALPSPISVQESAQQSPPWINTAWSGVHTQKLAAFIEFRTLPIGLPDPPSHVQIEAGPQDGMLLITWLPVPQDKNAVEAVTAAGASSSLPVQGYTVCLNGQAIMEMKGASRDHAILKLSTIRDHVQRLFNNCTQSSIDIYDHNNNSSNKFSTTSPSIIELYITVHSTIPTELSSKEEINTHKECTLLKGSEGPASKPIHLTACLLIMAAGSLETAYKVFGPNLATKLEINVSLSSSTSSSYKIYDKNDQNENTAKLAGVSLSLDGLQETTTRANNQNVENINSDEDHGLLVVSAENVVRKPSPTADALGSAEALLLRRKLEKQELKDDINDHDDHDPLTKINHSNQNISSIQKSSINQYNQYSKFNNPYHLQEIKSKFDQTRSISDDYDLNNIKDYYYYYYNSDHEGSFNSSISSDDTSIISNHNNHQWFRTSSSYNLTADYPNRQWKPRGVLRHHLNKSYPYEYYNSLGQFNKRDRIQSNKHIHYLYNNNDKMYPLHRTQHLYNDPKSFKSYTYHGRISPKHQSKRLFNQYINNQYPIISSSSNNNNNHNNQDDDDDDERYLNRIKVNQQNYINQVVYPKPYSINIRSHSTSPKQLHKLNRSIYSSRNKEIDYIISKRPIHKRSKYYRPLPLGIEHQQWSIKDRYYSGHVNPHENLSLPEIQITRNSSLSDNEPQFQSNDHYQQQSRYSYQDFRGPTRPIRSRFMDTRRHGSYDPQMSVSNFSTTRHDPDYPRPVLPSDTYTSGPKRPFHYNIPSPASGPIPQHEYRPSFNQVNMKNCRSGDQGSGLRQAVGSQYSRSSKSFVQNEQQYGRNQRNGFYLGECNGLRGLVPSNMVSELQSHSLRSQKINHSIDSHSNLIDMNQQSSDQLNKTYSTDINLHGQMNSPNFMNEHSYHPQMAIPDYIEIKDLQSNELEQDRNLHYSQSQTKHTTATTTSTTVTTTNTTTELNQNTMNQIIPSEQILIYGNMDDDGFYYGETKDGRRGLPNSDRTKLVHNTRSSSPCTQTRSYTTSNNDAVINTNINSTNYHRDELPTNDMERFPENEENPIIVMDLNPISNNSHVSLFFL
ncbi:RIMS-binding protein 2 [Schistosoma bovis]|uniref:RIMS-binding protein 2 n=1 Tax=Schistosoma bovis TaxID=6184 RepID=A0A430QQL9_SCHBO|nr:RIMS-binding protein 2 [Schistosoma bovis]